MTIRRGVLISGYYGFQNAGDEAILAAAISDLSARRPDLEFTVTSGNPALTEALHNVRAIRYNDVSGLYAAVADASLVIVGGGGLFHDYWGIDPDVFLTRRQWGIDCYAATSVFAALLGKPLVFYGVGAGPLESQAARQFTRVACEAATKIAVRDDYSRQVLALAGVPADGIFVTADPAYLLPPGDPEKDLDFLPLSVRQAKRPLLAVCVRHWDIGVHPDFWEQELARALDQFATAETASIVFLPFCRLEGGNADDAEVSERVRAKMRRSADAFIVRDDLTPGQLCRVFAHVDLTLAMRLHSLIFSAVNLTPAVGLSYDGKIDAQATRLATTRVLNIRSFSAGELADAMSKTLAGSQPRTDSAVTKLESLRQLARSNADMALSALEDDPGRAPRILQWQDWSNVLSRGFQALLKEAETSRVLAESLSDRVAAVEADREQSVTFLANENSVFEKRCAEYDKSLADTRQRSEALSEELSRAAEFQRAHLNAFEAIEAERKKSIEFLAGENLAFREQLRGLDFLTRENRDLREQLGALELQLTQLRSELAAVEAERASGRDFLLSENQTLREQLGPLELQLIQLRNELAAVEAERMSGRDFLLSENQTLREQLGGLELQLTQTLADAAAVEAERERGRDFLLGENKTLQEQLGSLELRLTQARDDVAAVEADRESGRDFLLAENRELLGRLTETESHLSEVQRYVHSVEAERNEGREFLRGEIRAAQKRIGELTAVHANAVRSIESARAAYVAVRQGIESYRERFHNELGVYRSQRAWKAMLFFRKGYSMLALGGWWRLLRWMFALPFSDPHLEDEELRFPSLRNYVPEPVVWPVVPEPASVDAPRACSPASVAEKYDVVILAIIDFDFRYQRPQQIAAQFAREGHRVFWISPTRFLPVGSGKAYRTLSLGKNLEEVHLRGTQPDIYMGELSGQVAGEISASLSIFFRDRAIAENAIVVQLPFWRQVALAMRTAFDSRIVYDCMDDWETFENMGRYNVSEERKLIRECDSLVVTGQALVDKFEAEGLDPVLVRNGADFDFFAGVEPGELLSSVSRPIVGYFGAIADWIDLELVYKVAEMRPQYSFVMVGQVFRTEVAGLDRLPNVHFMGNQEYQKIPRFLAEFDVCTIPFLINQVTNATDPVKLYEYFSQGKPVVATRMPELAQCGELVYLAGDATEFARHLDTALAESDASLKARRIEFARSNTWSRRVEKMDAAICSAFPLVSILVVTYNSAEFVRPCLDSIRNCTLWPRWEAILVDNASRDGTAEILREYAAADPRFQVKCLESNTGFAAGNNAAARAARGVYLVFLNVDTMVTTGWVGRLMRHLRRDPTIGIVCPVTNFAGNEIKVNVDYTNADEMKTFALQLAIRELGRDIDIRVAPLYCALIPATIWAEIGELDEDFGAGMFEDDDYSLRVQRANYRVAAAEDCFIHHFGQGSFGKISPEAYNGTFEKNKKRFEDKWQIVWQSHSPRPGVRPAFEERKFTPSEFCQ